MLRQEQEREMVVLQEFWPDTIDKLAALAREGLASRKVIADAPHGPGCDSLYCARLGCDRSKYNMQGACENTGCQGGWGEHRPCNCWKSKTASGETERRIAELEADKARLVEAANDIWRNQERSTRSVASALLDLIVRYAA
jgi:hypothetical protein